VSSDYRFENFVQKITTSKHTVNANELGYLGTYALPGSWRFRIYITDRKSAELSV